MDKKKILLLIDGLNFAFRSAYTAQGLTAKGKPIHLVFGFLRTYVTLMKKMEKENPNSEIIKVICWDSGQYEERMNLSEEGVRLGIIDKTYKQTRREKKANATPEEMLEIKDMGRQLDILNEILQQTNIMQVKVEKEEGDDVCASFVEQCKSDYDEIYLVTSDHDHYQLLDDTVFVYDAIKRNTHSIDSFRETYNIEPWQWVDLCSFVGDTGDTILGCNGMGEKKALPYIIEHKTIDGAYDYFHSVVKEVRERYPDVELTDDIKKNYPKIDTSICSGIRIALENKTLKKLGFPKVLLNAVEQEKKVRLAYKLKKMRNHLNLPKIVDIETDECILRDIFQDYSFFTLLKDMNYFLSNDVNESKVGKAINSIMGNMSDKKMYSCPHCKETFMSSNELDECPHCDGKMKEEKLIQQTLF